MRLRSTDFLKILELTLNPACRVTAASGEVIQSTRKGDTLNDFPSRNSWLISLRLFSRSHFPREFDVLMADAVYANKISPGGANK